MPTAEWTNPGERRRQVSIQQEPVASKTALGFLSAGAGAWTTLITTWAKAAQYTPKKGVAAVGGSDEPIIAMYYTFNIRYVPNVAILPGMRVVELDPASNGATYLIQSVVDIEHRHRELLLSCTQIPATAAVEQ